MTITQTRRDHGPAVPHIWNVTAPSSLDHFPRENQQAAVEGPFPAATGQATPMPFTPPDPSPAANLQALPIEATQQAPSPLDQRPCEAQTRSVEGPTLPAANDLSLTNARARQDPPSLDHGGFASHTRRVEGSLHPVATGDAYASGLPRRGPFLYNPVLCLLADSLDDIERLRIATENRYRALTRSTADSDGEIRGLGLDERSPQVARVAVLVQGIQALEHQATLDLQRELRASPFYPWVQAQKGVGQKQAARLLAAIGDPYWNDLHDRPRTVSELWAYSGYAVSISGRAQRRQKGVKSNWNDTAKMRAHLMAESCVKSLGGHYRSVYDEARAQYADAVHPHECVRCGPAGKPALEGSPLSLGHQHARALRRVAKEILRDLWIQARTLHEEEC